MWDYGTGKLIEQIPWNQSGGGLKGEPCMLYAAGFSKVRATSGTYPFLSPSHTVVSILAGSKRQVYWCWWQWSK
jgi:hypothetical protein